ncbi:MAG: hypothetical protein ACRDQ5_20905 [Sciscionella sp.]
MNDAPIDVEPEVFNAASTVFGKTVASQLNTAVTNLQEGLGGTAGMAGTDPGGTKWASSYDPAATVTLGGMTDLTNASYKLAAMLEATGFNHGRANDASNPSRAAPTPADTTTYAAPDRLTCFEPPSAAGGSGSPPHGWGLISHLVSYVWPNGDQHKLHHAAHAWTAAATTLTGAAKHIPEAVTAVRSQKSPEVDDAVTVCQAMMTHIDDVASSCRGLSTACTDLANHIDKAHKDIKHELVSLLEWTAAIETGVALLGIVTAGIAELPAQGAEAARVAATASRVSNIISRLVQTATTVAESITNISTKIAEVAQRLKGILGARLTRATATEVERLPATAKDAETVAEGNLQARASELSHDLSASEQKALAYAQRPEKLDQYFRTEAQLRSTCRTIRHSRSRGRTDGQGHLRLTSQFWTISNHTRDRRADCRSSRFRD